MWSRQRQWNTYSALPIQQRSLVQTSQDGSFKYYQQIPASLINSERNMTKLIKEWENYRLMDPARYGFSRTMVFLKHRIIIEWEGPKGG
ncbi:hypothetical protein PVAP13_3NG140710 [Panicum virgatum]|uniref:Uncharacterized protein n=1 Tax=Panicum virgatum TaxID=38727 RepID=A0A8T0UES0_PANVG|nr:hypothetical protein PVAP13_3NG140710 [Panicum virgatum]